jgi:hypothetical protein
MSAKAAASHTPERRPAHWDKRVSAAYLRIMGQTQAEAARAVGRSERTIREWEADREWWSRARDEARDRWMADAEDASRRAVLRGLEMGNSELGKWMLERVDPRLAPPKQKLEHTGKDGGPIETRSELAGLPLEELIARRDALLGADG